MFQSIYSNSTSPQPLRSDPSLPTALAHIQICLLGWRQSNSLPPANYFLSVPQACNPFSTVTQRMMSTPHPPTPLLEKLLTGSLFPYGVKTKFLVMAFKGHSKLFPVGSSSLSTDQSPFTENLQSWWTHSQLAINCIPCVSLPIACVFLPDCLWKSLIFLRYYNIQLEFLILNKTPL